MAKLANPGRWGRGFLVLFALGATLGALLDAIHTHFGATRYTDPVFFRMAWWTPLLFGGAFAIGLLRPLLERALSRPSSGPTWVATISAMGAFVVAYWVTVLPLSWLVRSAILVGIFALSWWRFGRTGIGLGIAAAAAFGGPLVEHLFIEAGTFVHLETHVGHVPGWLPFLYMCASVGLCALAKRLVDGGPAGDG